MTNASLAPVDFKTETTSFGTWKRHLGPAGQAYHEFTSHRRLLGMPILHYTSGLNPEIGRRKVARGFVAIGRLSVGVISIGQAAMGIVACGQLSLGLVLGLGQVCAGLGAIGQVNLGVLVGVGQVTTGIIAIGQLGLGVYVLAQSGTGRHVWDAKGMDEAAWTFFTMFVPWLHRS